MLDVLSQTVGRGQSVAWYHPLMCEILPMRAYRDGVHLSILGFGGMVVVGMEQGGSDAVVGEAFERGVNYFDVAPYYGDGEAELKLGRSLEPYRKRVFLACKTLKRDAQGARRELERSLRRLRTDHFDLYQFHAVTEPDDVEMIFAPGGAAEAFLQARREGKIRFIGFSAHSVEAALAMLERFSFDSVLFPVNFICWSRGNFGPQVLERARTLGSARLALKALAHGRWHRGEIRRYPNCWYRPIEDRALASQALRFTLSEDVTAVIPPGDENLFRMALELAAAGLSPLAPLERKALLESARGLSPLLRA
jgi:aryl-alcohol dehydrogenase-like predicted oxidoreductase